MKNSSFLLCFVCVLTMYGCSSSRKSAGSGGSDMNIKSTVVLKKRVAAKTIDTKNIPANIVVDFAETLEGVPYKYGSSDKAKGFDCSGFINYVFNNFKISVSRVSADFTNAGKEVTIRESKRGDIILFTGSDPKSGVVGHMGIITKNDRKKIAFIHSASGKGRGVMVTEMNEYFIPRFVKVIRIFNIF